MALANPLDDLFVHVEPEIEVASAASRLSTKPLETGVPEPSPLDNEVVAPDPVAVVEATDWFVVAPFVL